MNKYNIWIEGYVVTGNRGYGRCVARGIEANSFIEAVKKWYATLRNAEIEYGTLTIKDNRAFIWGCELFDNEADARKSFG